MRKHAYGLALVAALLVTATGAVAQQTVTVDAKDPQVMTPEELPGAYTIEFEVETDPQGPSCACTETTVRLHDEASPAFDVWNVKPVSYTIDWTEHVQQMGPRDADEPHVQQASITVGADEQLYEANDRSVTIEVEAWHRGISPQATTETDPLTVTLGPPGGQEEPVQEESTDEEEPLPSDSEESSAEAGWLATGNLAPLALALGLPWAALGPFRSQR